MDVLQTQRDMWMQVRDRLQRKDLLRGAAASVSMRVPGSNAMWFGRADADAPTLIRLQVSESREISTALHAWIYANREDVCAIAGGAGCYGAHLPDFGGYLPGLFDEQIRHLGLMPPPVQAVALLGDALASTSNALCVCGQPVVLGMTGARLTLNAEIFEKCAKAFVLAAAAGKHVSTLPWMVRWIANGRLKKDQRRAMQRTRQGLLPAATQGY
jgi:hypothetical protein